MFKIPKFIPLALSLALLASCSGPPEPNETSLTPQEIAAVILNSQDSDEQFFLEEPGGDLFDAYITGSYQIPEDYITPRAICYLGGVEAAEVAVLELSDSADVEGVEELLKSYLTSRTAAFNGYAPSQAAMAEDGRVESEGNYVALLVCEYPALATDAFHDCFEPGAGLDSDYNFAQEKDPEEGAPKPEHLPWSPDESVTPEHLPVTPGDNVEAVLLDGRQPADPEPEPAPAPTGSDAVPTEVRQAPEPASSAPASEPAEPSVTQEPQTAAASDDEYHPDLVLAAWQSGDSSQLGDKDKAILEAASAVIATEVSDDMEPWEKELALHDWIIYNVDYDPEALSNLPTATPDPDGDNPYGPLVNGVGVCGGYSSTFKLFMNMVGIPCVTVPGLDNNGEEHAWNKVQLDGDWYCVDTTWDDPTDADPYHVYFNVRDAYLELIGFQWDKTASPKADGTKYAYSNLEVN